MFDDSDLGYGGSDAPAAPIDPGVQLTDGAGSTADFVQNSGGSGSPTVANWSVFDTLDDGAITSTAGNVTTPAGVTTGTSGSSASGVAGWLSSLQSLATGAVSTAQQLSPLVNGQPATTPGTLPVAASSSSTLLIIAVIAVVVFLFSGKRR